MNTLSEEEKRVILNKGTEAPFSGEFVNTMAKGIYICRRCEAAIWGTFSLANS